MKTIFFIAISAAAAWAQTASYGTTAQPGAVFNLQAAGRTAPVKTGTLAQRPAACTAGDLYFATDGPGQRKLQLCAATDTWTAVAYEQGAGVPGSACAAGDLFFRTDATAGQNLYGCTAVNTWTQLGGSGGGGGYATIQKDGTAVAQRTVANFAGRGVAVDDSASTTRIQIGNPATTYFSREDMDGRLGDSTSGWGAWRWKSSDGFNVTGGYAQDANHPGTLDLTANNGTRWMSPEQSGHAWFSPASAYEMLWLVNPLGYASSDTTFRFGVGSGLGDPPAHFVGFETLDTDAGALYGVHKNSGTVTRTAGAVTTGLTQGAWSWCYLKRTGPGAVTFKCAATLAAAIDTASGAQQVTAAGDVSGNTTWTPFVQVKSTTANNRRVSVDYVDLKIAVAR
jgi:hypothetical protein